MAEASYSDEDLAELKKTLAGLLVKRTESHEILRNIRSDLLVDVDEFMNSRKLYVDTEKKYEDALLEIKRITEIILEHSKEYKSHENKDAHAKATSSSEEDMLDKNQTSYTQEELAKLKQNLAEHLVEKEQMYQETKRMYPACAGIDVDEYLKSKNEIRNKAGRKKFVIEEIVRISKILLEHSEEYQSPTTPGL